MLSRQKRFFLRPRLLRGVIQAIPHFCGTGDTYLSVVKALGRTVAVPKRVYHQNSSYNSKKLISSLRKPPNHFQNCLGRKAHRRTSPPLAPCIGALGTTPRCSWTESCGSCGSTLLSSSTTRPMRCVLSSSDTNAAKIFSLPKLGRHLFKFSTILLHSYCSNFYSSINSKSTGKIFPACNLERKRRYFFFQVLGSGIGATEYAIREFAVWSKACCVDQVHPSSKMLIFLYTEQTVLVLKNNWKVISRPISDKKVFMRKINEIIFIFFSFFEAWLLTKFFLLFVIRFAPFFLQDLKRKCGIIYQMYSTRIKRLHIYKKTQILHWNRHFQCT